MFKLENIYFYQFSLICSFFLQGVVSVILIFVIVLMPEETPGHYLPTNMIRCTQSARNTSKSSADEIVRCIQNLVWETGYVDWTKFNITKKEKHFINSLIGTVIYTQVFYPQKSYVFHLVLLHLNLMCLQIVFVFPTIFNCIMTKAGNVGFFFVFFLNFKKKMFVWFHLYILCLQSLFVQYLIVSWQRSITWCCFFCFFFVFILN